MPRAPRAASSVPLNQAGRSLLSRRPAMFTVAVLSLAAGLLCMRLLLRQGLVVKRVPPHLADGQAGGARQLLRRAPRAVSRRSCRNNVLN